MAPLDEKQAWLQRLGVTRFGGAGGAPGSAAPGGGGDGDDDGDDPTAVAAAGDGNDSDAESGNDADSSSAGDGEVSGDAGSDDDGGGDAAARDINGNATDTGSSEAASDGGGSDEDDADDTGYEAGDEGGDDSGGETSDADSGAEDSDADASDDGSDDEAGDDDGYEADEDTESDAGNDHTTEEDTGDSDNDAIDAEHLGARLAGGDAEPAAPAQPAKPVPPVKPPAKPPATVEHPILGKAQSTRAQAVLKKMSPADQQAVGKLMQAAKAEPEKQYLLKGVASGHSVKELQAFANKIRGKNATWMRDHLSLTGDSHGKGVQQQWSHSCNATIVEAVHGEMDPLYALKMHEDNPNLGKIDEDDATKTNPNLAADQKEMLTSAYHGNVAGVGKSGGVAVARHKGGGAGRWADDLLNDISSATGIKYSTKKIGEGGMTVSKAVAAVDAGLAKGEPVPMVIGGAGKGDFRHYVVVTGEQAGPPKCYSIHDPWSGQTVVRTEEQLTNGTLNIANSNQIKAIEDPA